VLYSLPSGQVSAWPSSSSVTWSRENRASPAVCPLLHLEIDRREKSRLLFPGTSLPLALAAHCPQHSVSVVGEVGA
jgi:hypothetical protein